MCVTPPTMACVMGPEASCMKKALPEPMAIQGIEWPSLSLKNRVRDDIVDERVAWFR